MNEQIIIPKNYEVEQCRLIQNYKIPTYDKSKNNNGCVLPLVNTLIPETKNIKLVYLTYCNPGLVKGPHMHTPPKYDRFVSVNGKCVVITRNEQTKELSEFILGEEGGYIDLLLIPPYNSHAIVSKEGCCVLSICNEGYYPGHYNQIETEYEGYNWNKWL